MEKQIKCVVCGEILGTVEKPEISEQDAIDYSAMMACSDGHPQTIEVLADEEQQ